MLSAPKIDDPVPELARGILNVVVGEDLVILTTVAVGTMVECSTDSEISYFVPSIDQF